MFVRYSHVSKVSDDTNDKEIKQLIALNFNYEF